ncbi:MAG: hypothetical protein KGZ79_08885 [Dethiobacter sp.]|nr:hypothetical protein [Dethiobacter sp.]
MKDKRTIALLSIVLTVSLAANIILVRRYTDMSKQQNMAWSNSAAYFEVVANWARLDVKVFTEDVPISPLWFDSLQTNLRMVERQLESLSVLPYSGDIYNQQKMKIQLFVSYQKSVAAQMAEEFAADGEISEESMKRSEVINDAWYGMLSTLAEHRNSVNPYSPIFQRRAWRGMWDSIGAVLDGLELIPL